ncbi:hypothetical protein XELAEV_18001953mg [Xenopus laevis]|uniref:Uncharacterized protein n=1 Tax=Xenopus laevis TaxID=8355 RepID=A0A974GYE8_XENLA|nr:hypothetical protein XELAEV_18001953mg [Xenopus laevis]
MVMVKVFRHVGPWDANWEGPYRVLEVMGNSMLKVQRPMTNKKKSRRSQEVLWVHIDQAKATRASPTQ